MFSVAIGRIVRFSAADWSASATARIVADAREAAAKLALDVYDPEPPTRTWPDDPRLILTPHVAGCTTEAKSAIGAKLYEKICAFYG
jgi:phosphoglycerate dehydrogenase-like enzyme